MVVLSTSISELSIIGHVPIDNLERPHKDIGQMARASPHFASQAINQHIPPPSSLSDTATTPPPAVVHNYPPSPLGRHIGDDDPVGTGEFAL